jgi:alpha-amylase/alpha-mannosidase (GH57 family)
MPRIHLILLWHMHQPLYKDPSSGRYVMPWTRLHALKDYRGMVRVLGEFPRVHATFNAVPSLMMQLEEYASGQFDEPFFRLTFAPADGLEPDEKRELLERAFQVNRDTLIARWPRFIELLDRKLEAGREEAVETFGPRDWRDLQVLSQLAWMDEEALAGDPVISELSRKGANFTEADKSALQAKELELLSLVLPEYKAALERGQIEISTTPYCHPILPLLCDSDVAREANPHSLLLQPPFRRPEDARVHLERARTFHQRLFGRPPAGLWPSEGSVSDQALELAAALGFRWFATDEGVLGKTLSAGFWRDAGGLPGNAEKLYAPLRWRREGNEMYGVFRDHYLSDLIGFVYSRMDQDAAAEDLHRRIRQIGERVASSRPLTVTLILDGENAWEYYAGGGRRFLRQFYRRIESDPEIRALTVSEAIAEAGDCTTVGHIAPGSWINANFDVWFGHAEDQRAWELLRNARDFYAKAEQRRREGAGAPTAEQLAAAFESVLAAEGSDWCWWYGPEHSSANDAEFDALYRKHLTEIYAALGAEAPEELAEPIKKRPEKALIIPPQAWLEVRVDGRVTSYFEWLGAGVYSADRQSGAMHGRSFLLHELQYGFSPPKSGEASGEQSLFVRVDPFEEALPELAEGTAEFRLTLRPAEASGAGTPDDWRIIATIEAGKLARIVVERQDACLLDVGDNVRVAFGKILEVEIRREFLELPAGISGIGLHAAIWQGGLPVDVLPAAGLLPIRLGEDAFAWF